MTQVVEQEGAGVRDVYVERVALVLGGMHGHGGEPATARLQRRVEELVLGGHRLQHLEAARLGALLDTASYEREMIVLDRVVVVQDVGESDPSSSERSPGDAVLDGRQSDGVAEPVEVAPEGVVDEVHAGLVVRSFRNVGLTGEADLSHVLSLGGRSWAPPVTDL